MGRFFSVPIFKLLISLKKFSRAIKCAAYNKQR